MNSLLLLSMLFSFSSSPGLSEVPAVVTMMALPLPPSGVGRGRGFTKMGTGRGLGKVGTGRGMGKVGTGRGFIKMGTGRGMGKVGTGRGLGPRTEKKESPPPPPPDPVIETNAPPEEPEIVEAPKPRALKPFTPAVMEIVKRGDRKMAGKDYAAAGREYHVAQLAEGFKGSASLRMAAAMVGQGRYYEGVNCLTLYVRGGGSVKRKGFAMPEDEALKGRLEKHLARAPADTEALLGAAIYALGRGEDASPYLDKVRMIHPGHPCLKELSTAAEEAAR
jgi:hypothetical protein